TIKKVTQDIEERFHFNTAISSIMELCNALYQFLGGLDKTSDPLKLKVFREAVEAVVLLLSPFAPHIAEELWKRLGNQVPVYRTPWPAVSEGALLKEEATLIVQINGKLRSKVAVPMDSDRDAVERAVMSDEKSVEWLKGRTVRKFVYVRNKIVNIVVE
ncbi:MAG: class I tRNA ligase family protein, partial [Deltaproteobacteria bacterium]